MRRTILLLLLSGLAPAAYAVPASVQVKSGDTLFRIATRTGVSVAEIRRINGLKSDVIRVGQVLRLVGAAASTPAPASASGQGRYTVKKGDTLSAIGARYGVSVRALQAGNSLKGTALAVGQVLKIPPRTAARPAPTTEVRVVYRYVRVGVKDTPQALAARYRLSVDDLRRLNGLGSFKHIVPGKKLLVPSRVPVPIPPKPQRDPVTFKRLTPLNVPMQIANVDLRWRSTLVAPVLPGRALVFNSGARVGELARRSGARVLVNGSYFHPQSFAPAGDIVMQGRLLTWGRIPQALAITPDNRAAIRPSATALLGRPLDTTWTGMETVIATGPRILSGGQVVTRYSTAFRDPALFGRAARSAVGLVSNRDLVLVSTHAKLTTTEMGKLLLRLGVRDALLLDGGSSAGIAWNGRAVLDSVRRVSYGIGVFTNYTGRRYAR
ncbi:LysM peptidoglycan-binding domain-containing protein [Deinococcus sp. JMULE3]|uniref:LysM peptidoglycan-binding domain-containing protein n=1 Tax=Deinococcus sp. JMULE3 TaxID=2518341 RepID=UPI0015762C84|nr:LysM peptidoglycan-binding domain-containing protein [Deinococcus sp. JMULE3]NTX99946.1 LysM peptidoglycan-binding domain-containing protein [Deinococcus sp. JMULE3]